LTAELENQHRKSVPSIQFECATVDLLQDLKTRVFKKAQPVGLFWVLFGLLGTGFYWYILAGF